MNTPTSNTQVHTVMLPWCIDSNAMTPRLKPIKLLPTSPINILAGDQFQSKNPPAAAAKLAESSVISSSVFITITIDSRFTAISSVAAIPSIPSIKLNKFSSQTSANTPSTFSSKDSGNRNRPKSMAGTSPRQ